jgi:hypothetical protein
VGTFERHPKFGDKFTNLKGNGKNIAFLPMKEVNLILL